MTLISKEFAELNEIKVGDRIILTHYRTLASMADFIAGKIDLPLEVIGIYKDNDLPQLEGLNRSNLSNDARHELWYTMLRLNTFWMPNQVLIDLGAESFAMVMANDVPEELSGWAKFNTNRPTFILHSPDDVAPFIEQFSPYVPVGSKLYANQSIYDQIKQPLQQTQTMARSVLVFSVLGAILIIGLTVLLFI